MKYYRTMYHILRSPTESGPQFTYPFDTDPQAQFFAETAAAGRSFIPVFVEGGALDTGEPLRDKPLSPTRIIQNPLIIIREAHDFGMETGPSGQGGRVWVTERAEVLGPDLLDPYRRVGGRDQIRAELETFEGFARANPDVIEFALAQQAAAKEKKS